MVDPKEGQEIEGITRCKILRFIARGGMGSVYLAEQQGAFDFKKTVAIKTIRPELLRDKKALEMFIAEAKLVADLIHENIAQVYDLRQRDDLLFLVMEYIKGITLAHFIRRHTKASRVVDTEMAAFIASRVARALSYAHNKPGHDGNPLGIVHRDVTPANVLIDVLGVVKLTDFGIAKGLPVAMLDEKKVLMGKYAYMSPELVEMKGTDSRSDVYSLGLVLYEMLTQEKLFPATSRDELLHMMRTQHIRPPHELQPLVSEELSEIVMSMLDLNPDKRIPTARKVVLALETYMYNKGYGPTNEKLALYLRKLIDAGH